MFLTSDRKWLTWVIIILLLGWFIIAVQSILLPFVVGMLLAYLLDPVVDQLETFKFPRAGATALVIALCFGAFILLGAFALPALLDQAHYLVASAPQYLLQIKALLQQEWAQLKGIFPEESVAKAEAQMAGLSQQLANSLGNFALGALASGMALLNLFSLLLITPVVAFYCLRDWDNITRAIDDLLPRPYAPTIREQLQKIDDTIAGFLRGQLNVCLVMGVVYGLGLTLVGLNSGWLIGLLAGLLLVVPYAGTAIAGIIAVAVAWAQFGTWQPIALVGLVFIVGQTLESNFLTPKFVGERVGLHPMWLIFGMLAGGALLGAVGVVLAVPLTAIIGVVVKFFLQEYRQSSLYQGGA